MLVVTLKATGAQKWGGAVGVPIVYERRDREVFYGGRGDCFWSEKVGGEQPVFFIRQYLGISYWPASHDSTLINLPIHRCADVKAPFNTFGSRC
jgi:hypothetical protein